MVSFTTFITLAVALTWSVTAFPSYGSLASLSRKELDSIIPTLEHRRAEGPPPPMKFNGTKLVNDADHSYRPPREGDMRGPCPGLNTLASRGYLPRDGIATPAQIITAYLPRDGVATPAQIITAVQEGLNMEYGTALLLAYGGLLLDGNVVTNLLSIGWKTSKTGTDPPAPATAGGLNTHGPFEGDASITRGDAYFGDNHSFNETLFQELVDDSNKYGAGKYNYTVADELRYKRLQNSIQANPEFSFKGARYLAGYAEVVFPVKFFIDGRQSGGQLDLDVARDFFQYGRMPKDFHRANKPMGVEGIDIVLAAHPFQPGNNVNGVNTYTPDPDSPNFITDPDGCAFYEDFVNNTMVGLYPSPTGVLREALNRNLDLFFQASTGGNCTQLFPYGKD
ncbi:Aromatic peroxygenase [Leucoagaricus sp. SymC.cos]|nr:Aromatic peroxygenase [Leucoagaricus sp. SymC.cos]